MRTNNVDLFPSVTSAVNEEIGEIRTQRVCNCNNESNSAEGARSYVGL